MVLKVAEQVNIPFTVGGGISSVNDVDVMLKSGADKIAINSSAVKDPPSELSQSSAANVVVASMRSRLKENGSSIWLVAVFLQN